MKPFYLIDINLKNVLIKLILILILLSTAYFLLPTSYSLLSTSAQTPAPDRINDIAKKLSCPTCSGINLADCRTQTCVQWREQIGDLAAQGYTDQEVLDYFAARYGDQVLQEPPRRGFALALWVLPVIALLVGAGWLGYILRRWARPQPAPATVAPPAPETPADADEYLRQVDRDLGG